MKIPVYIISLPEDRERYLSLETIVASTPGFRPHLVPGIRGSEIPDVACHILTRNEYSHLNKGTLGVFFSHSRCWEIILAGNAEFGLIIEDDVTIKNLDQLSNFQFPNDVDIIFCNDRTGYRELEVESSDAVPPVPILLEVEPVLPFVAAHRRAIGGDGYLLSRNGAQRLLSYVLKDSMFTHVDLRMFAYCLDASLAKTYVFDDQSRVVAGLRDTYSSSHKLSGRVLIPSVTYHPPLSPSRRNAEDAKGSKNPSE